eukprot:COSAG02_NODE_1602_length_11741_cov_35.408521_2_plen_789_part_00
MVTPEPEPEPEPELSAAEKAQRAANEQQRAADAASEALRIHGGMSGVEREKWRKIRDEAAAKDAVYTQARKAREADRKWREDKEAAQKARELADRRAAYDAERRQGNGRVYRSQPRFDVDLPEARANVATAEERLALARTEEEESARELEHWKQQLRTATAMTAEFRENAQLKYEEASRIAEQRCGITVTRPDRAWASYARGEFDSPAWLEARIAKQTEVYRALVASVEGMPQANRDIDAKATALEKEVVQLRLDMRPIIDEIQCIDPQVRGNGLVMEKLGSKVEELDLAADRKAQESLDIRKQQAKLWDDLPGKKVEAEAARVALAALQQEREALLAAEVEAGELIADWERNACDYSKDARAAVEKATVRIRDANREGRHAREALRKAQLVYQQLYERTEHFQTELAKRRTHYEETMANQAAKAAAERAEKDRIAKEKRLAAERKAKYEAECQAEFEAEQAERAEKKQLEMLAERASRKFLSLGKFGKVIVTSGSHRGALATLLYVRATFGRKNSDEYLPGMRLAVGTPNSGIVIWRTFDEVEPFVLQSDAEIRERGHGYVLAVNPALDSNYPHGGGKTRRLDNQLIRSRSAGAVRRHGHKGTDGWSSPTLAERKGPPASAPGLRRPGHVFYPVPHSTDPLDEQREDVEQERAAALGTQRALEMQLQKGRDAISSSLEVLEGARAAASYSPPRVWIAAATGDASSKKPQRGPVAKMLGRRPTSAAAVLVAPSHSRSGSGMALCGSNARQQRLQYRRGVARPKSAAGALVGVVPIRSTSGGKRDAYWI